MQCCQPHSNPSFSLFFSTLHRLPSSVNILKCLPLLLPASQKWWICNSDWLWRLVKNSLFLSHPPGKRVHFFLLTVARLPTHGALFSKTHNVKKGTFISSSLPLFNPLLTIHLSVSLHVEMGSIVGVCACVCACVFSKVLFADRVICLHPPFLTGEMSKHVAVCDWLHLTLRRHLRLQCPVGSKAACARYGNLYLSVWIKPCHAGMSVRPRKCQKAHLACITVLLPCWPCCVARHCFGCRRVSESLLVRNLL